LTGGVLLTERAVGLTVFGEKEETASMMRMPAVPYFSQEISRLFLDNLETAL
jgi:hypothetical protein